MSQFLPILTNTPPWVWVVLALLAWLGVQALKPRRVALLRVLITPAVFITWGLVGLALRASPMIVVDWLATAALGAGLAALTLRFEGLRFDRARGLVELPGSKLPLIRNLAIFAAKYVLAVAIATHPESKVTLALWDVAVSGLSAGYFICWALRFALAYRRAAAPA